MNLELLRLSTTEGSTIGALYADGKFECYTLEDPWQEEKIPGNTRIPEGLYNITLRNEGGMTKRYAKRFPTIHRGMLHLIDVPGFKYVYIHIGNVDDDTEGCILVGNRPNNNQIEDGFLGGSTPAYTSLYSRVADDIAAGVGCKIRIRTMG